MTTPQQTFYRKANGVLMIRDVDGRVRPATPAESAELPARPRRGWFRRFGRAKP
ncbi:MAG: hypothetical protein ACHQDE_04100 [Acidimicrobiia bacterium]